MKWGALLVLVTVAGFMLGKPPLYVNTWTGTEIIFEPNPSPYFGETSVNSNCVEDRLDRWHDSCNDRNVKVI